MSSNLHPDADYRSFDDGDWQECEDCGGEGLDDNECECESVQDICSCAIPTPRRCRTCNGEGGWEVDHSAEEQALWEADKENY